MTIDLGLMILVAFLIVWQLWWRTHVPLVIYATCAGFVLTSTWGPELITQLGRLWPGAVSDIGNTITSITLFLLPPALTAFAFRGTMGHRLIQQFVPAVFWVMFLIAFIFRLLPISIRQTLFNSSYIIPQLDALAAWTVLLAIGVASVELMSQHDLLKTRIGRKRGRD